MLGPGHMTQSFAEAILWECCEPQGMVWLSKLPNKDIFQTSPTGSLTLKNSITVSLNPHGHVFGEEPAETLNRRAQGNHLRRSHKEIFRPLPTLRNSNGIALGIFTFEKLPKYLWSSSGLGNCGRWNNGPQVPIPGICECSGKREVTDAIKLKVLRWGNQPGWCGYSFQCSPFTQRCCLKFRVWSSRPLWACHHQCPSQREMVGHLIREEEGNMTTEARC